MRYNETKTERGQEYDWTFDSWFEFVEFGKNRKKSSNSHESSRNVGNDHFTGTNNFQEAVELAENGWADGRKKITGLSNALLNKVTQLIQREEIRFDVTGNDFDIALVNQGVPECWMRFENTEVQSGTGHKVVRMSYNCAASAGISTEVITARGAAACALIEALEYAGFRVEVTLYQSVDSRHVTPKPYYTIKTLLKPADQQLDIDKLAFAIMHPSTLRRFMFAVEESSEQFFKDTSCYGHPADLTKDQKGDIYIAHSYLGELQWTSPKVATDWILSELRKQGVILSEEVPA